MHSRAGFVLLVGLLTLAAVGCGGPDTFDHSEAAKLYIEAMKVRPTDEAQCVSLLTQIIENKPMEDAYFHRGWIYAKQGSFDKANADVTSGLEMSPEHSNLMWLASELKKPERKRNLKMPPSTSK